MSKKNKNKPLVEGMNLGDEQSSDKEKATKTFNDFINKKTMTITAMSALALGGVFLATNVEAQESIRTTVNEVSVSVMKTRHSSDFEGKEDIQSDETIQKESSSALENITATWTDNSVEEIKAEIERQRELGLTAYVAQWGDTLSVLSEAVGVSVEYLVEQNNISDRHLILTGDILVGVLSNDMVSPNSNESERTISEEELNELLEQEEIEQIVNEIDTDGDGVVSIAEALAAGIELPIDSDHWLYPYMEDVNEDGIIDGRDVLVEYDNDNNGSLSPDELVDAGLDIDPNDNANDWINDYLDDLDDDNLDDNESDENNDDDNPDDNLNDDDSADTGDDDNSDDNLDDDVTDDAPNVNDDDNSDDDTPEPDDDDPVDVGEPDDATPGGPVIGSPDEDDVDPDEDTGVVIIDPDPEDEDEEVLVVGNNTSTRYEDIPFETVRIDDPELDEGEEFVDTPGRTGTVAITFNRVTYSDESYEDTDLDSETLDEPIDEVIRVGVKPIIDPDDESQYVEEFAYEMVYTELSNIYETDSTVDYGKPEVKTEGVTGMRTIRVKYMVNGLGDIVDDTQETVEDPVLVDEDGQERDVVVAVARVVRINPDELADIEAGERDEPTFEITPAPDLEIPDDDDLDDLDPVVKVEFDANGDPFEYHTIEQIETSRKPIVTSQDDAVAIDPAFDDSSESSLVGLYKPFEIPVLANEPINLVNVATWLGREPDLPDDVDLSPLDEDELRVVVQPVEGEETTFDDVYYFDGEEVFRTSFSTFTGNSGKAFIGKPQSFLD